jgi:hypothetical protein
MSLVLSLLPNSRANTEDVAYGEADGKEVVRLCDPRQQSQGVYPGY